MEVQFFRTRYRDEKAYTRLIHIYIIYIYIYIDAFIFSCESCVFTIESLVYTVTHPAVTAAVWFGGCGLYQRDKKKISHNGTRYILSGNPNLLI